MQIKTDLHMHTRHSADSRTDPRDLVAAAQAAGLQIIGVTDHNTVRGGLEARDAAKGTGLLVLVGQEVRTADGDLIVFSLEDDLPPLQPAATTAALAKELGGIVLLPHPFDCFRSGTGSDSVRLLPWIDLCEVFNTHTVFRVANRKATAFAARHSLPAVASSDAHAARELGSAYTILDTSTLPHTPTEAFSILATAPRSFHTTGGTLPAFLGRKLKTLI